MERRNSRSQSHPHGSERREERRRSVTDAVRATLIDAFSPSWLTDMMNQIRGGSSQQSSDSHEDGNTANRESRTNLTDSQRLSQSTPALYENGQPRTLDFSPHGTSQGPSFDSRSPDSAQPGPSQGSSPQGNLEFPQPGTSYDTSTRIRHQDFALAGTSNGTNSQTRQDFAQPSTSRGTPSGTRQNYAQPGTSSGTPSRSGRQDYAQPTTSRGRPLRPPISVPPVLEFTSSQLPLNRLTDEKSDSVLAQDGSLSRRSNSSHSTSGCSSMVPQSVGSTEPRQDTKRRRSSGESGMSRGTQTQPASQEHKRARLLESSSAANGSNISTWTERLRQAQQESERRRQQTQQDTPLRNNNPSFKPHLFGSPLGNNPRLEDFHNSLFYPGKTCFGGRNNFREDEYIYSPARPRQRNRQNDRQNERSNRDWPYPTRTVVRPRPRPDTEVSPVTGERSQRIMDLLNKMSTPMSDARRIPVVVPREWTANTRYSELMATGKRSSSSGTGPPTHGLQRGELASISANRQVAGPSPSRSRERQDTGRPSSPQPGPSGLQDNRAARNQGSDRQRDSSSRGSQQISDDRILVELEATKSRTVLRARRKSSENDEATVNLRTAPTVQVNSDGQSAAPVNYSVTVTNDATGRPRFDFEFSSPITERRGSDNSASPGTSGAFQFSSPIQLGGSQPSPNRPEPVATSNTESAAKPTAGFSFSTPSALKQGFVGAGTDSNFKPASTLNQGNICSTGLGFKPADKLKQGSVMDVLGNSGSGFSFKPAGTSEQKTVMSVLNSSGPGYKPSAKLKQGSVMDVLGNSGSGFKPAEKLKTGSVMDILGKSGSGFKPAEQLKKGSVMDILGNSGSGFKPAEKLKQGSVMDILGGNTGKNTQDTSTTDLMQKFRPEAGTWTCDSCLLQNKADTAQCVACQTPKPTEAQATSTTGLTPDPKSAGTSTTGLAPEPKSATTSTTGLAPEPKSAGTSTTGLVPEPKSAATSTTGFGPTKASSASASTTSLATESAPATTTTNDLAAMFKPASGSWSCDSCLLQNKADAAACVACQTPNPAKKEPAKKTVKKTWTCDVCLVPNEENVTVCVACQTAKPAKPFSHPPGDWSCDTCTFTNRATDIRCCNCEYIRPGPPRTQTVPGCVKTFLDARHSKMESVTTAAGLSNSTGFKLSSGVTSSSVSVNSVTTGGFKLDSSKMSGSGSTLGSGFKFGSTAVNNDSQSAGTGFKLANTSVSESQSLGSGFKFGSTPVSSSNSQSVGGFKFGNSSISVTSQSTSVNFQIGNTALTSSMGSKTTESSFKLNSASVFSSGDTQSKGLNFQFGGTPSTASNLFANPVLTSSIVSSQKPAEASSSFGSVSSSSSGAFSFEPKTTGEKEPFKGATLSVPGGFNFNTSVSSAISTATSSSQTGFTSIGGFNFSAAKTNTFTVNSVQASVCTTSPIGGFTFATKMPTAEGTQSTSASEPPKPAENAAQGFAGGFNSAQTPAGTAGAPQQPKPAENSTPGFTPGGFVFNPTQTEPPKPSPFVNFGSAPKPAENATPAFGGFINKPSASEPPKPTAFGGFSSAQGPSLSFGQPSPSKRSADEDSGEQSAKKPAGFNFTTGSSGPLPGTSNADKHSGLPPRHERLLGQRSSWKKEAPGHSDSVRKGDATVTGHGTSASAPSGFATSASSGSAGQGPSAGNLPSGTGRSTSEGTSTSASAGRAVFTFTGRDSSPTPLVVIPSHDRSGNTGHTPVTTEEYVPSAFAGIGNKGKAKQTSSMSGQSSFSIVGQNLYALAGLISKQASAGSAEESRSTEMTGVESAMLIGSAEDNTSGMAPSDFSGHGTSASTASTPSTSASEKSSSAGGTVFTFTGKDSASTLVVIPNRDTHASTEHTPQTTEEYIPSAFAGIGNKAKAITAATASAENSTSTGSGQAPSAFTGQNPSTNAGRTVFTFTGQDSSSTSTPIVIPHRDTSGSTRGSPATTEEYVPSAFAGIGSKAKAKQFPVASAGHGSSAGLGQVPSAFTGQGPSTNVGQTPSAFTGSGPSNLRDDVPSVFAGHGTVRSVASSGMDVDTVSSFGSSCEYMPMDADESIVRSLNGSKLSVDQMQVSDSALTRHSASSRSRSSSDSSARSSSSDSSAPSKRSRYKRKKSKTSSRKSSRSSLRSSRTSGHSRSSRSSSRSSESSRRSSRSSEASESNSSCDSKTSKPSDKTKTGKASDTGNDRTETSKASNTGNSVSDAIPGPSDLPSTSMGIIDCTRDNEMISGLFSLKKNLRYKGFGGTLDLNTGVRSEVSHASRAGVDNSGAIDVIARSTPDAVGPISNVLTPSAMGSPTITTARHQPPTLSEAAARSLTQSSSEAVAADIISLSGHSASTALGGPHTQNQQNLRQDYEELNIPQTPVLKFRPQNVTLPLPDTSKEAHSVPSEESVFDLTVGYEEYLSEMAATVNGIQNVQALETPSSLSASTCGTQSVQTIAESTCGVQNIQTLVSQSQQSTTTPFEAQTVPPEAAAVSHESWNVPLPADIFELQNASTPEPQGPPLTATTFGAQNVQTYTDSVFFGAQAITAPEIQPPQLPAVNSRAHNVPLPESQPATTFGVQNVLPAVSQPLPATSNGTQIVLSAKSQPLSATTIGAQHMLPPESQPLPVAEFGAHDDPLPETQPQPATTVGAANLLPSEEHQLPASTFGAQHMLTPGSQPLPVTSFGAHNVPLPESEPLPATAFNTHNILPSETQPVVVTTFEAQSVPLPVSQPQPVMTFGTHNIQPSDSQPLSVTMLGARNIPESQSISAPEALPQQMPPTMFGAQDVVPTATLYGAQNMPSSPPGSSFEAQNLAPSADYSQQPPPLLCMSGVKITQNIRPAPPPWSYGPPAISVAPAIPVGILGGQVVLLAPASGIFGEQNIPSAPALPPWIHRERNIPIAPPPPPWICGEQNVPVAPSPPPWICRGQNIPMAPSPPPWICGGQNIPMAPSPPPWICGGQNIPMAPSPPPWICGGQNIPLASAQRLCTYGAQELTVAPALPSGIYWEEDVQMAPASPGVTGEENIPQAPPAPPERIFETLHQAPAVVGLRPPPEWIFEVLSLEPHEVYRPTDSSVSSPTGMDFTTPQNSPDATVMDIPRSPSPTKMDCKSPDSTSSPRGSMDYGPQKSPSLSILRHRIPATPPQAVIPGSSYYHRPQLPSYSGSIGSGIRGSAGIAPSGTTREIFVPRSAFQRVPVDRNAAGGGPSFELLVDPSKYALANLNPSAGLGGSSRPSVRFNDSGVEMIEYDADDNSQMETSYEPSAATASSFDGSSIPAWQPQPGTSTQSSGGFQGLMNALREIPEDEEALDPKGRFQNYFRKQMERRADGGQKRKGRRSPPPLGLPVPPAFSPSPPGSRSSSPDSGSSLSSSLGDTRTVNTYPPASVRTSMPSASCSRTPPARDGSPRPCTSGGKTTDPHQSSPKRKAPARTSSRRTTSSRQFPTAGPSVSSSSSASSCGSQQGEKRKTPPDGNTFKPVRKKPPTPPESPEPHPRPPTPQETAVPQPRPPTPPDSALAEPRPPTPPVPRRRSSRLKPRPPVVSSSESQENSSGPRYQTVIGSKRYMTPDNSFEPLRKKPPTPPDTPAPLPRPATPPEPRGYMTRKHSASDPEGKKLANTPELPPPRPRPKTPPRPKSPPRPKTPPSSSKHVPKRDYSSKQTRKKPPTPPDTPVPVPVIPSGSKRHVAHRDDSSEPTRKKPQPGPSKRKSSQYVLSESWSVTAGESQSSVCPETLASASSSASSNSSAASLNTNQNATTEGVFAFGAQITTSASPAPASGPFVFGARPADGPAAGAPAPAFNFGQAPNMNFTAAAAPGSFAFSATPTTGDSSRKIKKAVRRIKR